MKDLRRTIPKNIHKNYKAQYIEITLFEYVNAQLHL